MVEVDFALWNDREYFRRFLRNVGANVRVLLSFSLGLSASVLSHGELYIWTDEGGRTHYSDIKPEDMKGVRVEAMTRSRFVTTDNYDAEEENENALSEAEAFQVRQKRLLDVLKEGRELQKQGKINQQQRALGHYCSQLQKQIAENSGYRDRDQDQFEKKKLTNQEREAHDVRLKELYQQNCE